MKKIIPLLLACVFTACLLIYGGFQDNGYQWSTFFDNPFLFLPIPEKNTTTINARDFESLNDYLVGKYTVNIAGDTITFYFGDNKKECLMVDESDISEKELMHYSLSKTLTNKIHFFVNNVRYSYAGFLFKQIDIDGFTLSQIYTANDIRFERYQMNQNVLNGGYIYENKQLNIEDGMIHGDSNQAKISILDEEILTINGLFSEEVAFYQYIRSQEGVTLTPFIHPFDDSRTSMGSPIFLEIVE